MPSPSTTRDHLIFISERLIEASVLIASPDVTLEQLGKMGSAVEDMSKALHICANRLYRGQP